MVAFDPAVRAAKLEDCNRHTSASRLVMAGVDLRTVAQLTGHKTISKNKGGLRQA
jgi:site-specific recombinase XerD